MQLLIRIQSGKTLCLDCTPKDTIESIKLQILDLHGYNPAQQSIVYENKILQSNKSISYYNLQSLSVLDLHIRFTSLEMHAIRVSFSQELHYCIPSIKHAKNNVLELKCPSNMMIGAIINELKLQEFKHALNIIDAKDHRSPIPNQTRLSFFGKKEHCFHIHLCLQNLSLDEKLNIIKIMCAGIDFSHVKSPFACMERILHWEFLDIHDFNSLANCRTVVERECNTEFDSYLDVIKFNDDLRTLNRLIVDCKKYNIEKSYIITLEAERYLFFILFALYFYLNIFCTLSFIGMLANLDVKLSELRDLREQKLKRIERNLLRNYVRIMGQNYIWSAETFTGFLRYESFISLSFPIYNKMTRCLTDIKFNGRMIPEINDSVLILCGISGDFYCDLRGRILNKIKHLLRIYGNNVSDDTLASMKAFGMCCGCTVKAVNTAHVPCGHMVYCKECSAIALRSSSGCPICRTIIATVVTTFHSGIHSLSMVDNDGHIIDIDDENKHEISILDEFHSETDAETSFTTIEMENKESENNILCETDILREMYSYLLKDMKSKCHSIESKDINSLVLLLLGITDGQKRKSILDKFSLLRERVNGKNRNVSGKHMCCVCTENEVKTTIVPCGHCVYCVDCAKQSLNHTIKCPVCRKLLLTIIPTFKSGFE